MSSKKFNSPNGISIGKALTTTNDNYESDKLLINSNPSSAYTATNYNSRINTNLSTDIHAGATTTWATYGFSSYIEVDATNTSVVNGSLQAIRGNVWYYGQGNSGNGIFYGGVFSSHIQPSAGVTIAAAIGSISQSTFINTATGTSTLSLQVGVRGQVLHNKSGSTVTTQYGLSSIVGQITTPYSGAIIGTSVGVNIELQPGSATVTSLHGINIVKNNVTGETNNVTTYTQITLNTTNLSATNKYGINQIDTNAVNHFLSPIVIGSGTGTWNATDKLQVTGSGTFTSSLTIKDNLNITSSISTEGGQIILHRGSDNTADWTIDDQGTQASTTSANFRIFDRVGNIALQIEGTQRNIGLGVAPTTSVRALVTGVIQGAGTSSGRGIVVNSSITPDSGTMVNAYNYDSVLNVTSTAYTLSNVIGYHSQASASTVGRITNLYGFFANSTIIYGDNNYGVYSALGTGHVNITNVQRISNVVTLTVGSHGFVIGNTITVAAATNTSLNGTFVVTAVVANSTISYAQTAADLTSRADTGTVYMESRYNYYSGNAKNCFMGNTLIGSATELSSRDKLQVTGNIKATGVVYSQSLNLESTGSAATGIIEMGGITSNAVYIDIRTDSTYTDYGLRILRNGGSADAVNFIYVKGTGGLEFNCEQAGPINFKTSATSRAFITGGGNFLIGSTSDRTTTNEKVQITGSLWASNFATNRSSATASYTVTATDSVISCAQATTLTLPTASSSNGRLLIIKNVGAFAVISASSNVVPQAGGSAVTNILAATSGKWATIQSNGTNWEIMMSN